METGHHKSITCPNVKAFVGIWKSKSRVPNPPLRGHG